MPRARKDYDEIPELTEEDFARGIWHKDGKPYAAWSAGSRNRKPKRPVSLRLDPDVLAHFRRGGRGWQSRINTVLRKAAKLPAEKRKKA